MRAGAFGLLAGLILPAVLPAGELPPAHSLDDLVLEAEIPISGNVIVFGFDALWMAGGPNLVRVDAADNAATVIPLPGAHGHTRALATGEGGVWVASADAELVYKVDPVSNAVLLTLPVYMVDPDGSLGVGHGSLWIMTRGEGERLEKTLARFDAATGAVQAQIPLPAVGAGVVASGGFVWVTSPFKGQIFKIDPATDTVAAVIDLGGSPYYIAAGEGSLWIATNQDPIVVQRVDPATGALLATIPVGKPVKMGNDIDVGGGFVWMSGIGLPLQQIDPATNSLIARIPAPASVGWLRYGNGSVWLSGNVLSRFSLPVPQ